LAAEAGLIDPESPHEASVLVENNLFNAESNGHAEDTEKGIEASGNPGDDVGGTSESNQGGDQGGSQGTAGNPPENPGSNDNPESGEQNGNAGGNAGNPGGDPPHPGGYGGFPDPEYLEQQNEDEDEEEEGEEIAQVDEGHAEDVTENITQNLLDIPLPFPQNPLPPAVHLPQNPVDDEVGDLKSQAVVVQSDGVQSSAHGDFSQAVQELGSFGDLNPDPVKDSAEPPTAAEESAPQETEPGVEGNVDENVLPNNSENPGGNIDGKIATESESEMDVSNVPSPRVENGVSSGGNNSSDPRDEEKVENKDSGNQIQSGLQLATENDTEEGLQANPSQSQGETQNANNEHESEAKPERGKESSESTRRSEQPLLTASQGEEEKSDITQVKTEQLDDMDTDSDALATLASAALGCNQAPTNGVKSELQVGKYHMCKLTLVFV
jgi:hypothetical protein